MSKYAIYLDSFSGSVIDLEGDKRTPENVLSVLREDPMISVWDMSENMWLVVIIEQLKREGKIKEVDREYPWHQYMTRGEFLRRYAKQISIQLEIDETICCQSADAGWEMWDGIDTPEEMADDEVIEWAYNL